MTHAACGAPASRATRLQLQAAATPHLLPPETRSAAALFAFENVPQWAGEVDTPLPEELAHAVPKRRAEYLAGRWCARAAVRGLVPAFAGQIGRRDRAPEWPPGVVGSITHTAGFACAAVARASDVRGIGIDSETIGGAETIAAIREVVGARGEARPDPAMDDALHYTILFSAKESLFKCMFPIARRMFWYEDAHVALSPATATFRAILLVDLCAELCRWSTFEGTYRVAERVVHTALVLPRGERLEAASPFAAW